MVIVFARNHSGVGGG